jgi:hypothetical protein
MQSSFCHARNVQKSLAVEVAHIQLECYDNLPLTPLRIVHEGVYTRILRL